jgi:hypothetical protein
MHPASYYLAQAYLAGLRHQTQRDALVTAPSAITPGGICSPHYRPRRAGRADCGGHQSEASLDRAIPE